MRTEGFKGGLLSTLIVASLTALAIPLLPTDRASALPEETKISITVDFPAPEVIEVRGYHRVRMEGLANFGKPGEPKLPIRPVRVLIPFGSKVEEVRVSHGREVTLDGFYIVEPAQRPVPLSSSGSIEPTPSDERIYNSSHPFPARVYSNPLTQSKRGYRILILNLYPVSYLPAEGELSYFEDIIVEVEFRPSPLEGLSVRCSSEDKQEIRRIVDNPEAIDSYSQVGPLASENEYKYVIITSEGLKNYSGDYDWQVLCDRKESRGITTKIVTLDWIYSNYSGVDNPEKIRNFIKYAYDNWETEYVLLGGDDTVVPFRRFWVQAGEDIANMPSDMYYSCLDGTFNYDNDDRWGEPNDGPGGGEVDLYAEVYVGRAPVASGVDVSNFVRKTLAYEDFIPENKYIAYMVGEHLGFEGIAEYAKTYKEEVRLGSDNYGYTTVGFTSCGLVETSTLYEKDGSWSKYDLSDIIDNGVWALNHLGHGNKQYAMKLYNSDLDSLTNTEYFFAYSQACLAGHFDGTECWAEKAIRIEDGAAAVVMNARYGWGMKYSTNGPSQHFDREFWDAVFGENIFTMGWANADSKEDQDWYITIFSYGRWCAYELNLFGDPELHFDLRKDRTPPPPPTLGLPANNAVNYLNYLRFSWENLDPIENTVPVTYHVQVDNNSNFSSPENENYWQPNNSFETNLQDGFWYWRVRARDNAGNVGEWSEVRIVFIKISGTGWGNQADWEAGTYENACVHNGSVSVGLYPPVPYFNGVGWDKETRIYEEVDILEATCKEGKAYFFAQDDSGLFGESGLAYAHLENTFYLDSAGVGNETLGFWWEAWSNDFDEGDGSTSLIIRIKKPDNSWVDLWSKTYYTPWGGTEGGRATVNVPSNILEESGLYTIRINVRWYFEVGSWFCHERFRWRVDNLSFGLTEAKHTTQWRDVGVKSAWQNLQASSDIGYSFEEVKVDAGEMIIARVEVSDDGENVDDYSEPKYLGNGISTYDISGLQDARYVRMVTYLMTSSLDHAPKLNEYVVTAIPILETILIEGNDNFTAANGVISGSGALEDPYIIENLNITAENANGIEIRNTTAHFVIRNCYVHDGVKNGIYFDSMVNGRVENCTCRNNDHHGIELENSKNNTLSNNTCENNSYDGINLLYSDNNTVVNNTCDNNNYDGIGLGDSVNNILKNNSCQNNNNGVGLWDVWMLDGANLRSGSDNNILINNSCESNNDGIYLCLHSDNNTLDNNTCEYNGDGIYLGSSHNNSITNNTCDNNYRGIYLGSNITWDNHRVGANNNTITNNTMRCNHKGIYLEYSDNNRIYHNNLENNEVQAYDNGTNYWDNGYPSGGNYWSDYTGADNYRGENQDILGSDGIGDTPHTNQDRYPLMNPWPVPHLGMAVFGLENLYAVSLDTSLYLEEGSKLVVKFYTYGDNFENESLFENFAPPAHIVEIENISHPENICVKKVRLDLTYDNTENVISTLTSLPVTRSILMGRLVDIFVEEWPFVSFEERSALMSEIVDIFVTAWPFAPF